MRKMNGYVITVDEFRELLMYVEDNDFENPLEEMDTFYDKTDCSRCGDFGRLNKDEMYLLPFPDTRFQRAIEEYFR